MPNNLSLWTSTVGLICIWALGCNSNQNDDNPDSGSQQDAAVDTSADGDSDSDSASHSDSDNDVSTDAGSDSDVNSDSDADTDNCVPPSVYHPGLDICVSTEGLHVDCEGNPSICKEGQECLEHTGFAGTSFFDCEITCGPKPERLCPAGFHCLDIADGPHNVCLEQE